MNSVNFGEVSIPQAVSTVATNVKNIKVKAAFESFNTASGKHCCNGSEEEPVSYERQPVSIPQAVSTVATRPCNETSRLCGRVSIPQAVSTVATTNKLVLVLLRTLLRVSIPQAVSTVATEYTYEATEKDFSFNTASGKHCCNAN